MVLTKSYLTELVYKVNGAAIAVHKALGPGLLESVYHKCLKEEFKAREIKYHSELIIPIEYRGVEIDAELRLDFLVEDILPVKLKAIEKVHPVHEAQLMTYMKLLKLPEGLLINFNVSHLYSEGQKTYVNQLYRELAKE